MISAVIFLAFGVVLGFVLLVGMNWELRRSQQNTARAIALAEELLTQNGAMAAELLAARLRAFELERRT